MTKQRLLQQIMANLEKDLATLSGAARSAHAAATHEECVPDNKYDTTALEASYIAQGQANRAADIRLALERYRGLQLRPFGEEDPIRLGALVTLEDEEGGCRRLFLGPDAGGMKVQADGEEWLVVTPEAPLGRGLLGRLCDDEFDIGSGKQRRSYLVLDVK